MRMHFKRLEKGDISKAAARREIGELLVMKESTLRNWIRKHEQREQAPKQGSLSYEQLQAAFNEQSKEVAKLRRANEILKTASLDSNCQCNSARAPSTPTRPAASAPRAQNSTRPTMITASLDCGRSTAESTGGANSGRPPSATARASVVTRSNG